MATNYAFHAMTYFSSLYVQLVLYVYINCVGSMGLLLIMPCFIRSSRKQLNSVHRCVRIDYSRERCLMFFKYVRKERRDDLTVSDRILLVSV